MNLLLLLLLIVHLVPPCFQVRLHNLVTRSKRYQKVNRGATIQLHRLRSRGIRCDRWRRLIRQYRQWWRKRRVLYNRHRTWRYRRRLPHTRRKMVTVPIGRLHRVSTTLGKHGTHGKWRRVLASPNPNTRLGIWRLLARVLLLRLGRIQTVSVFHRNRRNDRRRALRRLIFGRTRTSVRL